MSKRDYGDVPVGEMDHEEWEVPSDTDIEAYTGKSLDEIIREHDPNPPAETMDCEWVPRSDLLPNDWNPNYMPDHRRDLLILSILDNGWTAPVLVDTEDTIIDGEHRWRIAEHPWVMEWDERKLDLPGGEDKNSLTPEGVPSDHVPVHVVDADRRQKMLATYQQNYATGHDDPDKLGDLVDSLEEDDQSFAATRMGVTDDELELLLPDKDISGDTTELWDTPWDDDLEYGDFTDRIAFDMLEEEAQLVRHVFGADGTARPLVKLARFVLEAELYKNVEIAPTPSRAGTEAAATDGGEDDE